MPIIGNSKISLLLVLFFCAIGMEMNAQGDEQPDQKEYSRQNFRRAMAQYQINDLHDGILLVRLKTNQRAIDLLRAAGNDITADKVEQKLREKNNELIAAFRAEFDFCDVYFFRSEYSDLVRRGMLDSIPFTARHVLNPEVSSIQGSSFLVAEMTTLEADTTVFYDHTTPGSKHNSNTNTGHVRSNLGISALVFKDFQFIQLTEPFPYYVRSYESIRWLLERPFAKTVRIANARLYEFYKSQYDRGVKKKKPKKKKKD